MIQRPKNSPSLPLKPTGETRKAPLPLGERGWGEGAGAADKQLQLKRAKTLRSHQTEAEQRLWYYLRAHRFLDWKFKRQKPIGPYIADFVCLDAKLIIEADGGQHGAAYDQTRDRWYEEQGYTVLRFWNHEILGQTEAVLERIRVALTEAAPSPQPPALAPLSLQGRGASVLAASTASAASDEEPT